jgi:hypothetical protein
VALPGITCRVGVGYLRPVHQPRHQLAQLQRPIAILVHAIHQPVQLCSRTEQREGGGGGQLLC